MKCSPVEERGFGEKLSGRTNPMLRKLNGANANGRMLPQLGYGVVRGVMLGCQSPGRGGIWVAHGASRGFKCNPQEKPRQGRKKCTEQDVSAVRRRAECSFAPAGAEVVSGGPVTPGWRHGATLFRPFGTAESVGWHGPCS